jgi:hypothetical protein
MRQWVQCAQGGSGKRRGVLAWNQTHGLHLISGLASQISPVHGHALQKTNMFFGVWI